MNAAQPVIEKYVRTNDSKTRGNGLIELIESVMC